MRNTLVAILTISFTTPYITQAQPVIACGDEAEHPPFLFYGRHNGNQDKARVNGIAIDLLNEISQQTGIEYIFNPRPIKRCMHDVFRFDGINSRYEILISGKYSKEAAEKYYITSPIYESQEGLWYSKRRFPKGPIIRNINDLNPFVICGISGHDYNWTKEKGLITKIKIRAKNIQSALQQLSTRRCDLYIGALEAISRYYKSNDYVVPDDIQGTTFPGGGKKSSFHVFISKKSPRAHKLYTKINQSILLMQKTGKSKKIIRKFIPDYTPQYQQRHHPIQHKNKTPPIH